MSRNRLRNGLAACALAGLLAVPAHAAETGPRPVAGALWQWLTGMWQEAVRLTIDPNGGTAASDIHGTIDPNGQPTSAGESSEGDIHWTLDPNG